MDSKDGDAKEAGRLTQAINIHAGSSILGFIVVPARVRIQEVIYTLMVQIETRRTRVAIGFEMKSVSGQDIAAVNGRCIYPKAYNI